jgi:hypothetical protein
MGIVTSSATLLGYEEGYKNLQKTEPPNLLQRQLSLSTIHEERTSQLYDTPMGDVTVDEKGDVSFSFDGKEVSVSLYETPDLTEEEALQIIEMYADQISEHVTEQNIVELPPLRFVKESTTSGNMLMEALVIDVSPDYFPPEEDMRTEADMEDISVVDPLSQAFEEPLSEPTASKKKRKEESLRSGEVEEFFSLSQSKHTKAISILDNYVVQEAQSDDELTETDLQTFESAKSSEKGDSDKQKKINYDDSLQEPPKLPPRKKPSAENSSKAKDEDSIYLQDLSGEQGDGFKVQPKKKVETKTVSNNKAIIELVIKTVMVVENHLKAVENEVIMQSNLMMTPASADSSIGIIKSVLDPVNAVKNKVKDYNGEKSVETLVEELVPDLKDLNNGLSIIEKCVEMDAEGRTLVQRTSVCLIESVGEQMLSFLEDMKQVCLKNVNGSLQNETLLIINDMQTGIHITEDTIKSQTLMQEASAFEASQRVSDSIAQMQHLPDVVPPLKIVTVSELPKEADSFKMLCRHVIKFQEILEISQAKGINKEILVQLQKPIMDLQNEIQVIEDKIAKNSLKDTVEEKISFRILDTVSPPLYELNKCFETISNSFEKGETNLQVLGPFIFPLQEIQNGLASIGHEIDSGFIKQDSPIDTEDNQKLVKTLMQNIIYFESNIENVRAKTNSSVYDSLTELKIIMSSMVEKILKESLSKNTLQIIWALKTPVEELNYCFRHIEERSTSGSLRDLLDPLSILKENIEVVGEKLRQLRATTHNDDLTKIKNLVDQCDAEIQLFDMIQLDTQKRINQERLLEQQLSEQSQILSEMSQRNLIMQEQCDVLTSIQQNIINIEEIIGFEQNKSFSENLASLKTLAQPLRELSNHIANVREDVLMENVSEISENDFKAILKLAKPIREIYQELVVISKTQEQTYDATKSFASNYESLKSLANPLAELRNCIAAIQHEFMSIQEISGEFEAAQISMKTAKPLEELRFKVEELIHNVFEAEEESATLDDFSIINSISEVKEEHIVQTTTQVQHTKNKTGSEISKTLQTAENNIEKGIARASEIVEISSTLIKNEQIQRDNQTEDFSLEKLSQRKVAESETVNKEQKIKNIDDDLNQPSLKINHRKN